MSFCMKSTQVWVFPERRREVLSFDLQGGGERGPVRGHEIVTLLCVSVEAQFESLIINPSCLLIASLSYTLNGHPGPCPDKELFCPVLENIQMFPSNLF